MSGRKVVCWIGRAADASDPLVERIGVSVSLFRYTEDSKVSMTLQAHADIKEGDKHGHQAASDAFAEIIAYLMDHRHSI